MNFDDMTYPAKRQLALNHLRTNPSGLQWCYGQMKDSLGRRCSLGLMSEAFGIDVGDPEKDPVTGKPDWKSYKDPYQELRKILGLEMDHIWSIFLCNDEVRHINEGNYNYVRVADFTEKLFAEIEEDEDES
jgi:hypothetical protein